MGARGRETPRASRRGAWSAAWQPLPLILLYARVLRILSLGAADAARDAVVGTPQPVSQLVGGLVGRSPVERHERRRDTWSPDQVRPPAFLGHRRDLDLVRVARDGLFEAVDEFCHGWMKKIRKRFAFYASCRGDQAKAQPKATYPLAC